MVACSSFPPVSHVIKLATDPKRSNRTKVLRISLTHQRGILIPKSIIFAPPLRQQLSASILRPGFEVGFRTSNPFDNGRVAQPPLRELNQVSVRQHSLCRFRLKQPPCARYRG